MKSMIKHLFILKLYLKELFNLINSINYHYLHNLNCLIIYFIIPASSKPPQQR